VRARSGGWAVRWRCKRANWGTTAAAAERVHGHIACSAACALCQWRERVHMAGHWAVDKASDGCQAAQPMLSHMGRVCLCACMYACPHCWMQGPRW